MKKLKQLYKENRVFTILMGISLLCFLIVITMFVVYLVSSTSKSKYGNRLDGISDVKIDKSQLTDLQNEVQEKGEVDTAKINVHGKIIYFTLTVNDDVSMATAKQVANDCFKLFEDDYLNYYDFHFILKKDTKDVKNFPALGYRKAGAKQISWSHNATD